MSSATKKAFGLGLRAQGLEGLLEFGFWDVRKGQRVLVFEVTVELPGCAEEGAVRGCGSSKGVGITGETSCRS